MASLADPRRSPNPSRLTPGTVGAISELLAAADLMRRGYYVFRSLSPDSPCDLLAYRKSMAAQVRLPVLRLEVRTAKRQMPAGHIRFPLHERDRGTFDLLALVVEDDEIYYVPSFPGLPTCPYPISVLQLQLLRAWGVLRGAKRWQGLESNLQGEEVAMETGPIIDLSHPRGRR